MFRAIINTLAEDVTLVGLLSGGIHYDVTEISRQNTPAAFDANKELSPCALVKAGTTIPFGPFVHSASQTVEIWLYQRRGYETIEQAGQRIYQLLHYQPIQPVNDLGGWVVKEVFSNLGLEDNALGCSLGLLRYQALSLRGNSE